MYLQKVSSKAFRKTFGRLFAKHSAVGFEFTALGFRGHECCMLTSFSPQTDVLLLSLEQDASVF